MNESELLKILSGCRKNKRRHQEKLYRAYFEKMFLACRKYASSDEDALELLNVGFMQVFKKIDQYQQTGSFEGWMRRVITNAAIDFLRAANKHRHYDLDNTYEQVSTDEDMYGSLAIDDILKEIESLPKSTRRVFELHVLEGYPHKQIAEEMGIAEGTSKWHLAQAREFLKQQLKDDYQEFSTRKLKEDE